MNRILYIIFALVAVFILYSLLFPTVTIGPTVGKKTQAKNDAELISQAISNYKQEYGSFPSSNSFSAVIGILAGNNSKKIVFLDIQSNKLKLQDGIPIDPWNNKFRYSISEVPHVWSIGKDRIDQEGSEFSDDITSWK
jgi:type II secretory pathway pseudopilin PulG